MPLQVGNTWKYAVQGDFDTFFDTVRVQRSVPVGTVEGYELVGGMGVSRFAWDGPILYASLFSGQTFSPPLPLLAPKGQGWKGTWESAGKPHQATATLETRQSTESISGQTYHSTVSKITFVCNQQTTTLETWFVPRIGILKQEHRTAERLDKRIQRLSGP